MMIVMMAYSSGVVAREGTVGQLSPLNFGPSKTFLV